MAGRGKGAGQRFCRLGAQPAKGLKTLKTQRDSTRTGKESTAGAKHDLAWMDWMDPAMCVLAVLVESRASLGQGVVGLSCPFLDD